MINFDLPAIQNAIKEFGFDGWLLYDFRGLNVLAQRVLGIEPDDVGSRRYFFYVPAEGDPQKLVHRIETEALDHLPGQKRIYLRWQELHEELKSILGSAGKIAMEYSPNNANPYVSRVDGGTVELIRSLGPDVASSGNLVQYFEARWSSEQWELHLEADRLNQAAFEMAWSMVRDSIESGQTLRETDLQNHVMSYYAANNMTTYHPPIVAVGPHSGDPHYTPQPGSDAEIKEGDFLLLDMWAKMDVPLGVYSDLTKVGYVGDSVPNEYKEIFDIVAASRDAGIKCAKDAFAAGRELQGWEVDKASRDVIDEAGYGEYFIHRTGHNIGRETHGNGAHMDNLETKEERLVMTKTCFSIEPGIYMKPFGIRSEINVFVDGESKVHVTGGIQTEIRKILSED
ncbi:M24 family metallopeptidase [Mariniblastus fucicola]|uniref:Xaa-Pro dipeptidase n=1 Tax=Mariniblastus fucicola TaxID=980251 RepID=A0A5B9PC48_9BACT|nr:M24 family metallopeptidase [Mariniblastus fucicola]QEG20733.1 Xaa-Pro dipeptidase [Mariniblastus fucicola]